MQTNDKNQQNEQPKRLRIDDRLQEEREKLFKGLVEAKEKIQQIRDNAGLNKKTDSPK